MILSITAAAKAVGISRTTMYAQIKDGTLSRTPDGIDTAELVRVFGQLVSDNSVKDVGQVLPSSADSTMLDFMRDQVLTAQAKAEAAELEAEQVRADLIDTQARLTEHRDNARLLEDKSKEWQHALAERQAEIESARRESVELAERLQAEQSERVKSDARARALQNRGFIARLLNKQPDIVV